MAHASHPIHPSPPPANLRNPNVRSRDAVPILLRTRITLRVGFLANVDYFVHLRRIRRNGTCRYWVCDSCTLFQSELCRASRLSPFTSACLKDDGEAAGQVPRRPLRATCTNCPCGSLSGKSAAKGTTVFPIQGSAPFQKAALEFRATVGASPHGK